MRQAGLFGLADHLKQLSAYGIHPARAAGSIASGEWRPISTAA